QRVASSINWCLAIQHFDEPVRELHQLASAQGANVVELQTLGIKILNVSDIQRESGADIPSHVCVALREPWSRCRSTVPLNDHARPLRPLVRFSCQRELIAARLSLQATDVNGFAC